MTTKVSEDEAKQEATDHSEADPVSVEETDAAHHDDPHADYGHDVEYIDADHEDRQGSLAAKLLSWLVLLIAGGGVALWLAPQIAPRLPAWAEPARQFLSPGETVVETEMARLRDDVDTRIAGLPLGTDREAVQSIVAEATQPLDARITELSGTVGTLDERLVSVGDRINAMDSGDIEARLAALETEFTGLRAELESLSSAMTAVEGADISEETVAQLDANAARIDGLRAELRSLAEMNGTLSQRIDDVEAKATREVEEAAKTAEAAETAKLTAEEENRFNERLAALSAAAMGGFPFEAELDAFAALDRAEIPDGLRAAAPEGIASVAALDAEFAPLAHQAIRRSIRSEAGDGTLSKLGAFLSSQVATRSLVATDGDEPDAVLSRMTDALRSDDLDKVLTEAETLPDAAQDVLSTWLDKVGLRRDVLNAVSGLGSDAS